MRRSKPLTGVLLAAPLLLASHLLPQDDGTEPAREQGYPWDRIGSKRNAELLEKLLGAWRLTRITSTELNSTLRHETGVLLVTRDYASFELHIGWGDPLGGLADWQFQSGTHELKLDSQSRLQLTSVIGSTFDEDGDLVFVPTGHVRTFRIEVLPPTLILTRIDNGDRFEFVRLPNPSLDADKDIFGRERAPEDED